MTTPDSRRAAWRADLHRFSAEALRLAGLDAQADAEDTAAAMKAEEAQIILDLDAAKRTFRSSAQTDDDRAGYQAAKNDIQARRQALKQAGPPRPGIVDNFSEPSDAELIELGY